MECDLCFIYWIFCLVYAVGVNANNFFKLKIIYIISFSDSSGFFYPNWKKIFRFWTFFLSILQNYKVDSGKK
jgi:hypothetical protein